jgi:hypothetical protein
MIWGGIGSTSLSADFLAWGYQVVEGSTAKPYFPTTDRLNVPRLTYQNGGGGCPSLLLEPQRTNLNLWSEDFTQWSASNATVTANNTTSPDGTQNADRIQFTGAGFLLGAIQVSGTVYTISCYAKRNGSGTQSIGFFKDGSGTVDSAWALTSDWQRFTYTYTASNNSRSGIAGVNGGDVFVWGAQFEAGAYPTTYIPTTTASATRVADDCKKTSISSLIGQTEGTLFADAYLPSNPDSSRVLAVYNGTNNRVIISYNSNNSLGLIIGAGGSIIVNSSTSALSLGNHKIALAYKSGNVAMYVDGVSVLTNTSTYTFSQNLVDLTMGQLEFALGTGQVGIRINEAVLFKTRLTNSELASLTTI